MEMSDDSMEKEMDRLLELFKQLEVEKEVQETVEELNKLSDKQESLSEKTEKQEKSQEELKKEQDEIKEKFDEIQEKMEELEKKNEELKYPKDLGEDNEEQMEDIEEDLNKSEEQLEKNENQKASKSQKAASKKMKSMAGNLQSSMESGEMEQMAEDLKALRQLLENLVTLSFDQESLIANISRTNVSTPRYVDLVQQQFKIQDDFKLVEDSLQALSMRVEQIESFVIEKVTEVKYNLKESIDQLEERQKPTAGQNQRFTMKNLNDLALMLSESMNNMQQQMAGMMSGSQMCNKPGGTGKGKPGDGPSDKISEKQGKLNEEMKKMKEGMQKGGKGEGKGSAKEFAQAAAKQAALRKSMEEMMQKSQEQGKPAPGLQEIIDQMDEIETDLVNKRLDNQMLLRQQEILTRLLEAEEAERQREYDNKRKAEIGRERPKTLPPSLEEYIAKREAEVEMFKSSSPVLKPYYKTLVEEYYKALKLN
jgi:DNA repair exonuclease SbcCD ATPase subunit